MKKYSASTYLIAMVLCPTCLSVLCHRFESYWSVFCSWSNFHTFINTLSLTLLSIAQAHLHLNNFIHCNLHTLSLSHVNLNINISQTGHLSTIQSSTFKYSNILHIIMLDYSHIHHVTLYTC